MEWDGSDNKEVAHPQIRAQCTLNEVEARRGGRRVVVVTTLAWICVGKCINLV